MLSKLLALNASLGAMDPCHQCGPKAFLVLGGLYRFSFPWALWHAFLVQGLGFLPSNFEGLNRAPKEGALILHLKIAISHLEILIFLDCSSVNSCSGHSWWCHRKKAAARPLALSCSNSLLVCWAREREASSWHLAVGGRREVFSSPIGSSNQLPKWLQKTYCSHVWGSSES